MWASRLTLKTSIPHTMSDPKSHPFDSSSAAPLSLPLAAPLPLPSTAQQAVVPTTPGSVTSREAESHNKASHGPLDQPVSSAASQLRNRMENKPSFGPSITSEFSSSVPVNSSYLSDGASASGGNSHRVNDEPRPPKPVILRSISGPGGRLLQDENDHPSHRWTSQISGFLKDLYTRYSPSLTLENKGSIARDHLANERTYLAWLRSSLSLITVGVAVTQLFRLQSNNASNAPTNELIKVSELGRPLGGTFIALGILFLWLGTSRYFHSQNVLSYGQFPASRGSVIIATVTVLAVLLTCFIIVILQGRTK